MKIALHGFGKMGRAVDQAAQIAGHEIVARFDRSRKITPDGLKEADVVIDFSSADAVGEVVEIACRAQTNLVIGTSGWNELQETIGQRCRQEQVGIVYAPNFMPGANVFFRLAREAAALFAQVPEYSAGIEERHHSQKKDAPSGTALRLAREVNEASGGRFSAQIGATRLGHEFGLHTLIFDSPDDVIEISHRARGRMGFARGAILAAERIRGKVGFFTFEELLLG